MKIPKKKIEFSKILVVLITVYFFAGITIAVVYWMITKYVMPSEFLWAVAGPFTSVTGFYLVKSGWAQSALNSSSNYIPYYNERTYGQQNCYPQSYYPHSYSNAQSNTPYQTTRTYARPPQY